MAGVREDPLCIHDPATEIEPPFTVEPILGDPVRVPEESRRLVLILDECDQFIRSHASLVR